MTGKVVSGGSDQLSSKEATIFKQILKFYEFKQYKKGNKLADSILKKHPNHGETLAMKGLLISHLGQKEEAHEFIKRGIRNHITSHICWHVYGLLNRSEKNYEEAIKCYCNALKYDKDNVNILRDYSILQLHQRHYADFAETRNQLLSLRPGNRSNWLGLALAYHLMGKPDLAEKVLATFQETVDASPTKDGANFEMSEILLYRNALLEEAGDLNKALDDLETIRPSVTDEQKWLERKGRLLLRLKKLGAAHAVYCQLVQNNPDNMEYIKGLACSRSISLETTDQDAEAIPFLEELQQSHTRSNVLSFLPLQSRSGEEFKSKAAAFLLRQFQRSIPSTFKTFKPLLKDPAKRELVEVVVDSLNTDDEAASVRVWQKFFKAQLLDYNRDYAGALRELEEAIEIAPTLVELLMFKARVHKHTGDFSEASRCMEQARLLDLQDRFVNTKSTKYKLRNNELDNAAKTIALFVRADVADPARELVDLQCVWYFLERGECFVRLGELGKALRCYKQIETHFSNYYDDQFDFHAYALRRTTMRAYVDLLNFERSVRLHPFYVRAASNASRIYLTLAQHERVVKKLDGTDQLSQLSESERRKAARKAKKAQLKQQSVKDAAPEASKNTDKKDSKPSIDDDPDGIQLLQVDNPLEEAARWLNPLVTSDTFKPANPLVWHLGTVVYSAMGKLSLAWRCLKKLYSFWQDSSELCIAGRMIFLAKYSAGVVDPRVKSTLDRDIGLLFPDVQLAALDLRADKAKLESRAMEDIRFWACYIEASVAVDGTCAASVLSNLLATKSVYTGVSNEQLAELYYHCKNSFQLCGADLENLAFFLCRISPKLSLSR